MLSGSSVDLDTLIEIVDAYELADTSIISSITSLQADVDQNEADADAAISAEETARIAADGAATTDRAAIRSEFAAADTALSGAVAADFAALIGDLNAEESARIAADGAATTDRAAIRSEFAAADSAEAALRVSGDNTLQGNINTLSGAVAVDLAALLGDLQAEEAARIAADSAESALRVSGDAALQTEITNLSGAVAADFLAMQGDIDAAELEHQEDFDSLFAVTSLTANGNAATAVNFVDATSGNVVVTVPDGTTSGEYKRMKRKDASSNSATLSGKIEGNSSASVSMFDNAALMLVWDGAMWWIM